MGMRNTSGFTIIETMLFLAVTGLLIVGALVGVGTSLANQRYRDAVETFKTTVQAQYASLGSVRNDRTTAVTCNTDVSIADGSDTRGQTDCLIVGRYMVVSGDSISIHTVLAHEIIDAAQPNDIATLRNNYNYNVTPQAEERSMEWGTEVVWPADDANAGDAAALSILFIRSPETGQIYTFTSDDTPGSGGVTSELLTEMMGEAVAPADQARGERTMCVKSGGLIVGGDRSVYIAPQASSASAVEVRSNSLEGARQC